MTPKMKGKTDVTAGRATAARRGVGRVHHLDARLSWVQQLWAEGVVHWSLRSSQPGEHSEADLESMMIDSTLLLKGTPLRPPMSSSSRSLRMVAASFPEVEAARDCRVSTWNVRKHMRDEWLVLDLCGNGHSDPDGVVRSTIWDFQFQMTAVSRKRPP